MSAAANPVFCSSVRLARTIRRLPSSIQTMSVMASKVRSHSFFSREISSKRIAFSSAIAMCLATGQQQRQVALGVEPGTVLSKLKTPSIRSCESGMLIVERIPSRSSLRSSAKGVCSRSRLIQGLLLRTTQPALVPSIGALTPLVITVRISVSSAKISRSSCFSR